MRAQRAGPQPFSFCISHGLDAALNFTEEMRFPKTQLHNDTTVCCKVATPLKRCWEESTVLITHRTNSSKICYVLHIARHPEKMAISFKLLQRPPAAYRGRGHQTCQPKKNSVGRIHMASGTSSDQLSVESVNQVHTQTSKYFIDQYRMIVLLRRKIIQSKNNSFSKERNKTTEQMILNANVHFVLSRLKFHATQMRVHLTGESQGAIK